MIPLLYLDTSCISARSAPQYNLPLRPLFFSLENFALLLVYEAH